MNKLLVDLVNRKLSKAFSLSTVVKTDIRVCSEYYRFSTEMCGNCQDIFCIIRGYVPFNSDDVVIMSIDDKLLPMYIHL